MSLYPGAKANLSLNDQRTLDLWEAAAEATAPEGPNVVTNVRSEAHMVGNPPQTGTSALEAFLVRIATVFGASGAKQAFERAAKGQVLQGRLLPSGPRILYRFRPLDAFGESVARANGEVSEWIRSQEKYLTDLLENWNTLGKEKVARAMLGAARAFL